MGAHRMAWRSILIFEYLSFYFFSQCSNIYKKKSKKMANQYMLAPDINACGMSNPIWGDYLCGGPYTNRIYGDPQRNRRIVFQNAQPSKEGFGSAWIQENNISSYGLVQPGLGFRQWFPRYDAPEMPSWDDTMRQMQMHYARFK